MPVPDPEGGLIPIPILPPPMDRSPEDIILVMQQDLWRTLAKPLAGRHWGVTIDLQRCIGS